LIPDQERTGPGKVYTVSEITQSIKTLLEGSFPAVWVEGEVSNCHVHGSGHCYCSLKDDAGILSTVIFSRIFKDVRFKVEDGLKVVCFGSISVYGPQGRYQLIVEKIEPKGIGALQLALEQLKERLEKEGLFAPAHKKPIPYLPAKIGIVTSLTGAAIKDMLKVLERRFKDVHILISPVRVQGEGAKEEIAEAINDFNAYNQQLSAGEKVEVLIVGRGGGSIEDLWAFNEELVSRAIYASRIPVISAVGHERDVTISDLVADVRAATPSVAAELVLPEKEELRERLDSLVSGLKAAFESTKAAAGQRKRELDHRLFMAAGHILELNTNHLRQTAKKLSMLNPAVQIPEYKRKILDRAYQIFVRTEHLVKMRESGFRGTAGRLAGLNPLNILARGYSATFVLPEMAVVKDARSVKPGDLISTKLARGEIVSAVKEIKE
jgi:exodeoxyribonuclease VII large subunit